MFGKELAVFDALKEKDEVEMDSLVVFTMSFKDLLFSDSGKVWIDYMLYSINTPGWIQAFRSDCNI